MQGMVCKEWEDVDEINAWNREVGELTKGAFQADLRTGELAVEGKTLVYMIPDKKKAKKGMF